MGSVDELNSVANICVSAISWGKAKRLSFIHSFIDVVEVYQQKQ